MSISDRQAWVLVGLLTVLGIALRVACASGLVASDDMGYSEFARQLAQGTFGLRPHHYALRLGLTVPVAVVYAVFGVAEWSTILVPLVASSLSVPLIVAIGWRMFGLRVGLLSGLLLATFPVQLYAAGILVPEAVAEFYVLVAVLLFLYARDGTSERRHALAGVCLGIAYLTKEPALFVFPALFFDRLIARRWRAAMWLVIGLGAVVVVEHVHYLVQTGDLLYRPHSMQTHEGSGMAVAANRDLAYRLTQAYPRMMLLPNASFGLHSLLCIVMGGIALLGGRAVKYRAFLLLWALIPFLYLNFGSSSLTRYFALPVQPRYVEFVYPSLFLLTALLLDRELSEGRWRRRVWSATIALVAFIGSASGLSLRGQDTYAGDVAVLREIARGARQADTQITRFEGDKGLRWWRAMMIIDVGVVAQPVGLDTSLVVFPDALGLPTVRMVEQTASTEPSSPDR